MGVILMFCKNCGSEMDQNAVVCVKCGYGKGKGNKFCPNCGSELEPNAQFCVKCGVSVAPEQQINPLNQKSKIAAGLLGIFLGGFGIHNFYLGYTGKAVGQLVLTICSCGIGGIWGFIEGILILCGNINTDANGVPLKD